MLTYLADLQAFPFSQAEFMSGNFKPIDSDIALDAGLMTTASPMADTFEGILASHKRVVGLLEAQSAVDLHFGIQMPPKEVTPGQLHEMAAAKIRFMPLAYELSTEYGGGFGEPDAPLTERGKAVLEMMAEADMVLDLAHMGHRTAREAFEFVDSRNLPLRIVATHVGCYQVYPHLRNLPDDVLLAIRSHGGLIGLLTATWMLAAEGHSIDIIRRHLDHLLNLVGPQGVCIGSDGIYRRMDLEALQSLMEKMIQVIDPRGNFKPRLPDQPDELNSPRRLEVLADYLSGYYDLPVLELVMGKNLQAFFAGL